MPTRDRPVDKAVTEPPWRARKLLLMTKIMRLVGNSLAPDVVLREMLHLISELLGVKDFVEDFHGVALEGLENLAERKPAARSAQVGPSSAIR